MLTPPTGDSGPLRAAIAWSSADTVRSGRRSSVHDSIVSDATRKRPGADLEQAGDVIELSRS
jgi:hypothetical protein